MVGQDVVTTLQPRCALRPHAHHRKVRGAAADVGHQHQLFLLSVLLVVEGRRNRLKLERHVGEAHGTRSGFQRSLRRRVPLRFVVHEKHRAAHHHLVQGLAAGLLGQAAQVAQVAGDDVEVLHAQAVTHLGCLVHQGRAQDALHRAHQAPFVALDVGLHGGPPEGARQAVVEMGAAPGAGRQVIGIGAIEHRRGHGQVLALQRHQAHPRPLGQRARDGDGRIGGAEVDGAVRHGAGPQGQRNSKAGDCRRPRPARVPQGGSDPVRNA